MKTVKTENGGIMDVSITKNLDDLIESARAAIREAAERSKETDRKLEKSRAEFDQRMEKSRLEFDQRMEKSRAEFDQRIEKSRAEFDQRIEKSRLEFDQRVAEHDRMIADGKERMDKLSANLGGIGNSLGDMAEGLMASDLYDTFSALGLDFDSSIANYVVKDKKTKRELVEVDMLLVNGTIAMAVETKTTMTIGDVDKHVNRLKLLRSAPNSLFANRTLYGAIAGVKMSKKARLRALINGFYVVELAGNTIKVNMPEDWKPKTW
jgi:hypothetical protein